MFTGIERHHPCFQTNADSKSEVKKARNSGVSTWVRLCVTCVTSRDTYDSRLHATHTTVIRITLKMASTPKQHRHFVLIKLCLLTCVALSDGQSDQSSRHYNRDGVYVPPNPGDRDYKTFTYNDRRYGQYQPNYYYGRGEPLDPRRIGGLPPDRGYDPVSKRNYSGLFEHLLGKPT